MLVAYRCDALAIRELNNLMGHESETISHFMQRAMFAHIRSLQMNKAKEYTGKVKTLRLVRYTGTCEDDIRALEFTAMIQDQTFNIVHMITDDEAKVLTEKYSAAYKGEVDSLLDNLRAEIYAAIDDGDACLSINATAASGSLSISANRLRHSEFLKGVAGMNDRARDAMTETLEVNLQEK